MGARPGPPQTSPNEPLYNVHGRKLNFHVPHNDGGHAIHASHPGAVRPEQHVQDGRKLACHRAEAGLYDREFCQYRLGLVQVPEYGAAADSLERLAGVRRAADSAGVFGRWRYVSVELRIKEIGVVSRGETFAGIEVLLQYIQA